MLHPDTWPLIKDLPPLVAVGLVAMLPVVELRGAIPLGYLLGLGPLETFGAAVIGNLIPMPVLVWGLEPTQRWLSDHSETFRRFFGWLFTRTRKRHGDTFERFKDIALISFVALPLPGTGGWTGSAAAFVFGVRGWRALLLIATGIVLAGAAVTVLIETGSMVVRR